MTSTTPDPEAISQAYARLSTKFKTLWTFHQFLQGVHRTSLRGVTGPMVSFAPLYEQIKRIKETKGVEPAADTRAAMARLDGSSTRCTRRWPRTTARSPRARCASSSSA